MAFTLLPPSADNFYADGTQVTVTAVPQNGFKFKVWTGDLSGANLTSSLTMSGPRSAVAVMDGFPFVTGVKKAAGDTSTGTVGPGSMLTADNPAVANETISIYGTGFGLYDRPLVDGFNTPDTGNWNLLDPVKVTVDGQPYTPITSRAANGLAGMVVLRVKLTGTLPSGLINIKATVNNVDSNTSKLPIK